MTETLKDEDGYYEKLGTLAKWEENICRMDKSFYPNFQDEIRYVRVVLETTNISQEKTVTYIPRQHTLISYTGMEDLEAEGAFVGVSPINPAVRLLETSGEITESEQEGLFEMKMCPGASAQVEMVWSLTVDDSLVAYDLCLNTKGTAFYEKDKTDDQIRYLRLKIQNEPTGEVQYLPDRESWGLVSIQHRCFAQMKAERMSNARIAELYDGAIVVPEERLQEEPTAIARGDGVAGEDGTIIGPILDGQIVSVQLVDTREELPEYYRDRGILQKTAETYWEEGRIEGEDQMRYLVLTVEMSANQEDNKDEEGEMLLYIPNSFWLYERTGDTELNVFGCPDDYGILEGETVVETEETIAIPIGGKARVQLVYAVLQTTDCENLYYWNYSRMLKREEEGNQNPNLFDRFVLYWWKGRRQDVL